MIGYLVVLGGLLLLPPQNETEVSADLDRSTAEVGETVILTVRLRASSLRSPEIESPQLGGFEILATSDRSSFRFSTAAGAVREFSRQYASHRQAESFGACGDLVYVGVRKEADRQGYDRLRVLQGHRPDLRCDFGRLLRNNQDTGYNI